jgi:hypothetical protein
MAESRPSHVAIVLLLLAASGLGGGWLLGRTRALSRDAAPRAESRVRVEPKTPIGSSNVAAEPARSEAAVPLPRFENIAAKLGVQFDYMRGETGDYWLPETMGGGVAWLDFDGDGRMDLFCVQGCQLPSDDSGRFAAVLYRNVPGSEWVEVPKSAGPSNTGYGVGVTVGDIDNDGFDDIYVTNFGPHTFWVNHGDGTFSERSAAADLRCSQWGTSAAFGDLDRDGDLELFVTNYAQHDPNIRCTDPATGRRKYCGPDYFDGQPCVLFENEGAGRFNDISASAGIARSDGKSLGVVIADLLDEDGVPEIFVANDLKPNFLFRQAGAPLHFEEAGFALGAAVNAEGVREANMGIACGDYDEDADLDLYVTHYYMEHDTLWENQGSRGFSDVTKRVGLGLPTMRQLSWGTNFIDYDNDGWLDLFVTSGHINDSGVGTIPYAMTPQLFRNLGSQTKPVRFSDVSARAGSYFQQQYVGRSSATADFDLDGRVDLAVGHHHKPFAVLHNESEAGNAIGLILVGKQSNRGAIGARITVILKDGDAERRITRELIGGGSYISADSREVVVGVGQATQVRAVEIRWPSGLVSRYEQLHAGSYWIMREGESEVTSREFSRRAAGGERNTKP